MDGHYCLGIQLPHIPKEFNEKTEKQLAAVLILTAPHPFAGYLIYYPKEKLKNAYMDSEAVVQYNISIGTVL